MKAGWEVKPLNQVASLSKVKGGSRPLIYVGLEDISSDGTGQFLGSREFQSGKSTTFEFGGDHLLYGRLRPYLNKVLLPDFEGHCSSEIFPILTSSSLDRSFLFYWLTMEDTVERINATCTGARMPRANVSEILTFSIPLPPLDEQKRIVAVLDAAFDGLTRASANIEANLQNARELFESYLETAFKVVESDCSSVPLANLCGERGITYGVIKLGEHVPMGTPCLRTSNVRPLKYELGGMKHISTKLSEEYSRTILKGGEVLVSVRGTLGGVCVVHSDMAGWNISREVAMVDVKTDVVSADFVALYIATNKAQSWLTGMLKGAAYKGINLSDLRKLELPLPTLEIQKEVIREVNQVELSFRKCLTNYQSKLADLDELRQSLLQKAFAGELT